MRFNGGSPALAVILCVLAVVFLYYYWSVGNQLMTAKSEIKSLKGAAQVWSEEKLRLSNRLSTLVEDLKREDRLKREMETKTRAMNVKLDEAQLKLVKYTPKKKWGAWFMFLQNLGF